MPVRPKPAAPAKIHLYDASAAAMARPPLNADDLSNRTSLQGSRLARGVAEVEIGGQGGDLDFIERTTLEMAKAGIRVPALPAEIVARQYSSLVATGN